MPGSRSSDLLGTAVSHDEPLILCLGALLSKPSCSLNLRKEVSLAMVCPITSSCCCWPLAAWSNNLDVKASHDAIQ